METEKDPSETGYGAYLKRLIDYHSSVWSSRYLILAASVLALAIFSQFRSCEQRRQFQKLMLAVEKGPKAYAVDPKTGRGVAIEDPQVLKMLSRQDSTIRELNALVESIRGQVRTAAVIRVQTRDTVYFPHASVIEVPGDTVRRNDTVWVHSRQRYNFEKKDQWADIRGSAGPDSVWIRYAVRNDFKFDVSQGRKWWGGVDSVRFRWQNMNPHTATREVYTYSYTPKKPKRLLWLGVGVGIGFVGGLLVR